MNKTFKIIVKLGTLSLPSGAVVFFGGDRLRQPRDGTMLDETPEAAAVRGLRRGKFEVRPIVKLDRDLVAVDVG